MFHEPILHCNLLQRIKRTLLNSFYFLILYRYQIDIDEGTYIHICIEHNNIIIIKTATATIEIHERLSIVYVDIILLLL